MNVSLRQVILFVHDVERLAVFYRETLGLTIVEHTAQEWCVLAAGSCQLALHRVGEAFRKPDGSATHAQSNVKLVLWVDRELTTLRAELVAQGVPMGPIKIFAGVAGPLCDGNDPEGNVFQLVQVVQAS